TLVVHGDVPQRTPSVTRGVWCVAKCLMIDTGHRLRTGEGTVSVEFLLTTLIVVITPGTGVLYTMAAGLSRALGASVVAAVGGTLGIVPHMVAAITGLAALLHTSAAAFQILK